MPPIPPMSRPAPRRPADGGARQRRARERRSDDHAGQRRRAGQTVFHYHVHVSRASTATACCGPGRPGRRVQRSWRAWAYTQSQVTTLSESDMADASARQVNAHLDQLVAAVRNGRDPKAIRRHVRSLDGGLHRQLQRLCPGAPDGQVSSRLLTDFLAGGLAGAATLTTPLRSARILSAASAPFRRPRAPPSIGTSSPNKAPSWSPTRSCNCASSRGRGSRPRCATRATTTGPWAWRWSISSSSRTTAACCAVSPRCATRSLSASNSWPPRAKRRRVAGTVAHPIR